MKTVRSVLLVHNEPEAFRGLEEMLHELEIRTSHAHACAEARNILRETYPVDAVLTDVALPDGTWKGVIRSVRRMAKETPVIVMSRVINRKLCLDTQDAGAADFIVPPIAPDDLAHVLTTAMYRTSPSRIRREGSWAREDQRSRPPAH